MATRPAQRPPEPEPPEAQEEPQSHVAAVTAAAVTAALAAGAVGVPKPPTPNAVALALKTLLEATDHLFRSRRVTFASYIVSTAESQMPGVAADRVSLLAAEEMRNEAEFQRKARQRLMADLPVALREVDPAKRAEKVQTILEREKRYLIAREHAAAQRLVASLESELLERASPHGAFWQLSPLIRHHCPRCLAMAGKFWPWDVLHEYRLPMHPNCGCTLLSLDEAVARGLMSPGDIPGNDEAKALAKTLQAAVTRLEESMTEEEIAEAITGLEARVAEASVREILRWGKGHTHGGQFRPKTGGNPGELIQHEVAALKEHVGNPWRPGRTVHLKGEKHFVAKDEDWAHKIGSIQYTSPWGTTRVYKSGTLLPQDHKDLAGTTPVSHDTQPSLFGVGGETFQGDWKKLYKPPPEPKIEPGKAPAGSGKVIPDYTGEKLSIGKAAGGTTGAKFATDEQGNRWLLKMYRGDQDRVATELLSNAIYRAMGAKVAPAGTYYAKADGKPIVALAYPTLSGSTMPIKEPSRALGQHYMTDALVANWDFIGMTDDNVLWAPDGTPARLDQGGTLQFRAQGELKPFGPIPTEVWTLKSAKGQAYDKVDVTEASMREQALQIAQTMTPDRIAELVAAAPFKSKKMRLEVEQALLARVGWMRSFAMGEEGLPQPLTGHEIAVRMDAAQAKLEPSPEQVAAVHRFVTDEGLQSRMQAKLRGKQKLTLTQNQMRLGIDNLLYRQTAPEDMTVYRIMDPAQLGPLDELTGKVVKDQGFGTATSSRPAARNAPGVIELHVPAGSHVLHTDAIAGAASPDPHVEVLTPRQTRMRIKGVSKRGNQTILHAVMLP